MKKLHKILVCIDLSEYSMATMEYGVAMARGMMMDIVVLNVINIRDVEAAKAIGITYPERINIDEYVERTRKGRRIRIQELIDTHFQADSDKIQISIELGVPFRSILETVEKEEIDIVVIGNKGRGNVVGTLFGSTAEKVFRHSKAPVLSVRDSEHFNR